MRRKSAAPGAVDANGAAPPVPFASSRPHPFRSLVQLAPGQPAYGLGLRMAILITVPMIVGAAVHEIGPATLVSIGTLNSYFGSVSTALDHITATLDHLECTLDDLAGHGP